MIFPDLPNYWNDNDSDDPRWEFVWSVALSTEEIKSLNLSSYGDASSISLSVYMTHNGSNFEYLMSEWEVRDRFNNAISAPAKNLNDLFHIIDGGSQSIYIPLLQDFNNKAVDYISNQQCLCDVI